MKNPAAKFISRFRHKIDYKALLPVLILSAFLLICFTSENNSTSEHSAAAYEQLELKSWTDAESSDDHDSRSMATSPASNPAATVWIMAASLTTSTSNQSYRASKRNSEFSNISAPKAIKNRCRDKNTLSMVASDLGRQFTLLGEKPSGTS